MTPLELTGLFDAVASIVNVAFLILVWRARKQFAQRREIEQLERRVLLLEHGPGWHEELKEKIGDLAMRLSLAERNPDWEEIGNLRHELGDVKVQLSGVGAKMEIHNRILDRIEGFLLEHGK